MNRSNHLYIYGFSDIPAIALQQENRNIQKYNQTNEFTVAGSLSMGYPETKWQKPLRCATRRVRLLFLGCQERP